MNPPDRPILNLDDLTAAWRFVDGGHGYSAPQLFALLIDADRFVLPTVIQIYDDDLPGPDDALLNAFVDRLGETLHMHTPGGSVAIMRARPGAPSMTSADLRWCRSLHRHLRAAPFSAEPLFFATDASVGPVPPDVLIGETTADLPTTG